MSQSPFMVRVRECMRLRHLAYTTEKSYCHWIRYFILQQGIQNPDEMNGERLTAFLTYLAVEQNVSPNTQNQAFNALLFLFKHVLQRPLENIQAIRAKERRYVPVVLTTDEVEKVLAQAAAAVLNNDSACLGCGFAKSRNFAITH